MRRSIAICALLAPLFLAQATRAQFEQAEPEGVELGQEQVVRVAIGVNVRAVGGPCTGIIATAPIPMEWPEQHVEIVEEELNDYIGSIDYRDVQGTAQQLLVRIPQLPSGETARAVVTFEVTRREVLGPTDPDSLSIPAEVPLDMRLFLGASPYIEVRDRHIREAAAELRDETLTAWQQVEKNYDWVREQVEYTNGPIKGAAAALEDGTGDCEELTSLFIAICRAQDIPARTVWVPGHCYPEFYLVDEEGEGHWFPCQAAGDRSFGSMPDLRYILQKGDNFRVPEHRDRQRYVAEFLQGNNRRGSGDPEIRFIQSLVPVPQN